MPRVEQDETSGAAPRGPRFCGECAVAKQALHVYHYYMNGEGWERVGEGGRGRREPGVRENRS
jgi:hypothetical protein